MAAGRQYPTAGFDLADGNLERAEHRLVDDEGLRRAELAVDHQTHRAVIGELGASCDGVSTDAVLEDRRGRRAAGIALVAEELGVECLQTIGNVARIVE